MKKIKCGGYTSFDGEYTEFECEYENAPRCDDCVCVPFGCINPITGKKLCRIQRFFKFRSDKKELSGEVRIKGLTTKDESWGDE